MLGWHDGLRGVCFMSYGGFMKFLVNSIRFSLFSLFFIMPLSVAAQRPAVDISDYNGACDEREALKKALSESLQEAVRHARARTPQEMAKEYNGDCTEEEALQIALSESEAVPAECALFEIAPNPYEQDDAAFGGGNAYVCAPNPYETDDYPHEYAYFDNQAPVNSAVPYGYNNAYENRYNYSVNSGSYNMPYAEEEADRIDASQAYKPIMQKTVEANVSMCQKISTALLGVTGVSALAGIIAAYLVR